MAADPAEAAPFVLLAMVLLGGLSAALGIALGKARVEADVRRRGGRVTAIRYVWRPFLVRTRKAGFHVDLVDPQGRPRRARAYPAWGKVFWREGQETISVGQHVAGTLLDAEWWRTPYSGPPGVPTQRWEPVDSPPTARRNRLWWLPLAFGALFLANALGSLASLAGLALATRQWSVLALPALTAAVGAALVVWGLRLRR